MAYDDWFSYGERVRPYGSGYRPARRAADERHGYPRDYWRRPGGGAYGADPWREGLWREAWPTAGERADMEEWGPRRRAVRPPNGYGQEYLGRRGRAASRRGVGHEVPPDYRRYLSREEYGLDESWERGSREEPGRSYAPWGARGPRRFDEGVLGPRNALFGGEGFRRYDADYEQWW